MFWNLQTYSLTLISNSTRDLNQFNCHSCFCTFSVFSSLALFCALLLCALCFLCHRRCFAPSAKMTFGQKIRCLSCRVLCIFYISFGAIINVVLLWKLKLASIYLPVCVFLLRLLTCSRLFIILTPTPNPLDMFGVVQQSLSTTTFTTATTTTPK